ncbi:ferritin-like domain-containing protein [uncultured Tyzzerella sp.]|uniref:ferritin-like domain-containing protein n=1 Tax=uncultured Tyzzerella sp. TaxID=2321398 RepID=UPI00294303F3|nr:ferritin-like domain-containing protein [uncultured Tyzzerella sp.]
MYPYFSKKDDDVKIKEIVKKDEDDLMEDKDDLTENKKEQEDFRRYIIEALEEAIEDQHKSSIYYEKLYNMVEDEKDKDTLRQIALNEMKYKKIFMELYKMLTGKEANIEDKYENVDVDDSLIEELQESIEEQLEDIDFYRMLMSLFSDLQVRDMIYEVILGKQKNAQLISNLYNKYK